MLLQREEVKKMAGNQNSGRKKGGQSSKGKGWHGDPMGHAMAGAQSSGNRTNNRGRGRASTKK